MSTYFNVDKTDIYISRASGGSVTIYKTTDSKPPVSSPVSNIAWSASVTLANLSAGQKAAFDYDGSNIHGEGLT